jgi:hypothetical protein
MEVNDLRISKLRTYLLNVIDDMTKSNTYQINANMLSNKVDDYSLDKIPTAQTIEEWITGTIIYKDVYSFKSRKTYSQDTINNLKNIGFFEEFERIIKSNNDKGILPDIDNVEEIKCLNCGTMLVNDDGKSAIFNIQIQVTYRSDNDNKVSL